MKDLLEYIEFLFWKTYGTSQCTVCKEKIKCNAEQFLQENSRVKCTQCKRYLKPIKVNKKDS